MGRVDLGLSFIELLLLGGELGAEFFELGAGLVAFGDPDTDGHAKSGEDEDGEKGRDCSGDARKESGGVFRSEFADGESLFAEAPTEDVADISDDTPEDDHRHEKEQADAVNH